MFIPGAPERQHSLVVVGDVTNAPSHVQPLCEQRAPVRLLFPVIKRGTPVHEMMQRPLVPELLFEQVRLILKLNRIAAVIVDFEIQGLTILLDVNRSRLGAATAKKRGQKFHIAPPDVTSGSRQSRGL